MGVGKGGVCALTLLNQLHITKGRRVRRGGGCHESLKFETVFALYTILRTVYIYFLFSHF